MTPAGRVMSVLLDEGAPVLTAEPFLTRGHRVIYHGDVLESGARDDQVAALAILNHAALIAIDLDMKRLVRRFGAPSVNERFAKLDLISVSCNEVLAAKRLKYALSLIEHEWDVSRAKTMRRLWVDLGPHRITSYR